MTRLGRGLLVTPVGHVDSHDRQSYDTVGLPRKGQGCLGMNEVSVWRHRVQSHGVWNGLTPPEAVQVHFKSILSRARGWEAVDRGGKSSELEGPGCYGMVSDVAGQSLEPLHV